MAHLEVLAEPVGRTMQEPPQGRLFLQTVVPTDRRSAGGRTAFSVSVELTPAAGEDGLFATLLAGLLFTLGEELVGVVAEVRPLRGLGPYLTFATEDRRSLRSVIAQHWQGDRRLQFHVCPLESFRRGLPALRSGQPFDPAQASVRVVQNQNRSGLIIRGAFLNAVRARAQVERLCLQYGLELIL